MVSADRSPLTRSPDCDPSGVRKGCHVALTAPLKPAPSARAHIPITPRGSVRAAARQHLLQLVAARARLHGRVARDLPAGVEAGQRLVRGLHTGLLLANLHGRVDLMHLVFSHQVAHRARRHQHFERRHASAANPRQQRLADHAFEHERQLGAHLRLLVSREHVDHASNRLRRRARVQAAEREMARLCDPQRRFDRLEVPHLADEDHVGILAKRSAERAGEAAGVGVNLALVHQAALVRVDVLDRIFDREDVALAFRC